MFTLHLTDADHSLLRKLLAGVRPHVKRSLWPRIRKLQSQLNWPVEPSVVSYRIQGGTHLGIVGCYGEKTFKAKNIKELIEKVRTDRNLGDREVVPLKGKRGTIYQFMDADESTAFEFKVMERTR